METSEVQTIQYAVNEGEHVPDFYIFKCALKATGFRLCRSMTNYVVWMLVVEDGSGDEEGEENEQRLN